MKNLLLTVLFICGNTPLLFAQNDHLEPVRSTFNAYRYELDYDLEIRRLLLQDSTLEQSHTAFLVMPSFEPESVSVIYTEGRTGAYFLEHRVAEKSIWYSLQKHQRSKKRKEPLKINIHKSQYQIDKVAAIKIQRLFNVALSKIKFKEEPFYGLDGTSYYFFTDRPVSKVGQTWSPRKGSKMKELVEISKELIKLTANRKKIIRLDSTLTARIDALITRFNKED